MDEDKKDAEFESAKQELKEEWEKFRTCFNAEPLRMLFILGIIFLPIWFPIIWFAK